MGLGRAGPGPAGPGPAGSGRPQARQEQGRSRPRRVRESGAWSQGTRRRRRSCKAPGIPEPSDDTLRRLPGELWDKLRADPSRAPEHLALAASDFHGPAAEAWAADRRATFAATPRELAKMAKRRHATLARFGGAASGIGGIVTMIPDLAALAWIQSRLVFFVAAAYGYDARDEMRPAELLVIQGLYRDPAAARSALDGVGRRLASAYAGRRLAGEEALAGRLLKVVGRHSTRHLVGRMIPGLAIVTNAIGNERGTRALADRAIAFYGG